MGGALLEALFQLQRSTDHNREKISQDVFEGFQQPTLDTRSLDVH